MIFYFSATGNSHYLSKKISEKTGDRLVSVSQAAIEENYCYEIEEGERIGFVFPVFFSGAPKTFLDFLKNLKLNFKGNHYTFCAMTCGGSVSMAEKTIKKPLEALGLKTDAVFGCVMPDNYIFMYDISDMEGMKRKIKKADVEIEKIASLILSEEKGDFVSVRGPKFLTKIMYPMYKLFRKTRFFSADENCNGCQKCVKECPEKAIEIIDGKITWIKKECSHCLHCIHSCPKKAIQMGKATKKRNRYMNPYV
ncbi:MAG: EFR1 family ferrodoxin [Clostridia bacterium]|nr:EFR1 family ferrodoxin [Clostridia bacterium]